MGVSESLANEFQNFKMGVSESLANEFQVIKEFNDFISFANDLDKQYLADFGESFNLLKATSEQFLNTYKKLINENALHGFDLNRYFQKIILSLEGFKDCVSFLKNKARGSNLSHFLNNFQTDLSNFLKFIIYMIQTSDQILTQFSATPNSSLLGQLCLSLAIFNFSIDFRKSSKPPKYTMTILPAYKLYDKIQKVEMRYINITAPHASGKTTLIPLQIGCRLFSKQKGTRLIVVVEHEQSIIHGVKTSYKKILSVANAGFQSQINDDDDDDNDHEGEILTITSSLSEVSDFVEDGQSNWPCIAILSPHDALSLFHKFYSSDKSSNSVNFVKETIFVIDDVHLRKVETDVLIQDFFRACSKSRTSYDDVRIATISTVNDLSISYFLGTKEPLTIASTTRSNVRRKDIISKSIPDIENKSLFNEMRKFFNNWLDEGEIEVGSVIVFVPSEKVGQRLYRQIFKYYGRDSSTCVCPLRSTIKKGEKIDNYYSRLIGEMTILEEERRTDKNVFILPINLNDRFVTREERHLIKKKLPPHFKEKKLARLIITTIKNEPILQLSDLRVIFDTGVEEVEFFDPLQSIFHIKEQLLPSDFIVEHEKLLGHCGEGIYFSFNAENMKRPDKLVPYVKRGDLGRELLLLRRLDIKLEKQRNLPNEPNHDILDECINVLKKIGIIDDTRDNNLTTIGSVAEKFSSVSPFFALAVAKFTENQQFAFLCALLIENSRTLVLDQNSELLTKNFNRESDVVTLLDSIYDISKMVKSDDTEMEKSGFSIGTVYSIYSMIESTFEGVNGRTSVINSLTWSRSKKGGTLAMVDKFVSLLDENDFLSKRKVTFKHVIGAGQGNEPILVYNANKVFSFDNDDDAQIRFARRPGWIGLQSPGGVISLNIIADDQKKLNRGLIIHHDQSSNLPGVVSFNVNNPGLNSVFFVSLFDAYWSDRTTINDFNGIYHTLSANNQSVSLIHMTENRGQAYINFCPKNGEIENEMRKAIPVLSSIMPFVPRSIITKVDQPFSAIEVIGEGPSSFYVYNVHIIEEDDIEMSIPFCVNKKSIDFCVSHIELLMEANPKIRFALTGECFYYKEVKGRQVEADLTLPDSYNKMDCVFDDIHSTHLILLVDKELGMKPQMSPLKWIPSEKESKNKVKDDSSEKENNDLMLNVASKIMNGIGYAERSTDFFFVMINNGYPTPNDDGQIPDSMRPHVGYSESENKAIKGGVYSLIRHFLRDFTRKQKLTDQIPIKSLSSTNSWKGYPSKESDRENLCDKISNSIKSHFKLKEDDEVQAKFLGQSMIAVRVDGLKQNLVLHKLKEDVWDDSYQPCKADIDVANAIKKTTKIPVTQVVHVPTMNIKIWNMLQFQITPSIFEENVKEIVDKFGFLVSAISSYTRFPADFEQQQLGVLGDINIEVLGMPTGIAFATSIKKQFNEKYRKDDLTLTCTMTATCLGMTIINPDLGPAPRINASKRVFKVDPSEIETLRQLVARYPKQSQKKFDIDTNYNVLIVPMTEDAEAKKMIREVRDKENDTTCQFLCDGTEDHLPQSIYAFNKDGSVKALAVCRQCMVEFFRSLDEFQLVLDPATKMVDRKKLSKLTTCVQGFPLFEHDEDENNITWPQIPLGQAVMTLVSDTDLLSPYVKSWFTMVIDYAIRKASNYFTKCPNHPDILYRTPKPGISLKCPQCNMFFCGNCKDWHKMDDVCLDLDDGLKRCPNCRVKTNKLSGCNHIACPCGKHWCFKCDASPIFATSEECYAHMDKEHGGYYT